VENKFDGAVCAESVSKKPAVKIVTDSTTEISQAEAKKLGITVVPLKSLFGDEEFLDGIDFTPEEFFVKLSAAENLPTTSQPSPHDFEKVFREAQNNGEQVIAICITDSMSGTGQSARIAKEICGGDIWVVDSETATIGIQILVKRALQLAAEKKSAQEIVCAIEKEKKEIRLFAAVDTLDFLLKGGRLSRTSAIVGSVLNVKPLITVLHGKLSTAGKCLGMKKAYKEIFKLAESSGEIDFSRPFAIGYTGDRERFGEFEEICAQHFGEHKPIVACIGAVIGTHVGPGAVAISYFKK